MSHSQALKNIPQYRQGTSGEAKFVTLLKEQLDPNKELAEQLTLAYRITDYFTANVVDNFNTNVWRMREDHQYIIRSREDKRVLLVIQSKPCVGESLQITPIEYIDILALNVTQPTIKRICEENGFVFTKYNEYNNVDTFLFEFKNPKGLSTSVSISVEKDPARRK